jgi:hypothetical protein
MWQNLNGDLSRLYLATQLEAHLPDKLLAMAAVRLQSLLEVLFD